MRLKKTGQETSSYWMSISDLMSGLLLIFILTLAFYIFNFTIKNEQLEGNKGLVEALLVEITEELKGKGFTNIQLDKEHFVLRLPEGVLFDSGQADIKPDGARILTALSSTIVSVLNKPKYKSIVETIFVEGHTDKRRLINSERFLSNWELSTQRAINAWREMQMAEVKIDSLRNDLNQPLFSCSGYAETRPVDLGDSEEALRSNRRIDLRFSAAPYREAPRVFEPAEQSRR